MIRRILTAGLVAAALIVATPAGAQFMAADLLYLPAAAHINGEGDSFWRSDLYITNVQDDVDIDIAMAYLPSGLVSNAGLFYDRVTWLGGREDDGFGFIDPLLMDIPPGGTVVIRDPIGNHWSANEDIVDSGAIVIFAYEANTLEDDGTRVLKNAIVNSRVYTRASFYEPDADNEGEFVEVTGTYGLTLPAVAWYNLADPSAVEANGSSGNFTYMFLSGAAQNTEFRYNLGILNASDPLTTITVTVTPHQGNGEVYRDNDGTALGRVINLPPLAHIQYNNALEFLFGLDDVADDTVVKVSFLSWTSGSAEPVVAMTTYGTMIDNQTNDPTTILPVFGDPYNVECQWPSSGDGSKSAASGMPRVRTRPIAIPSR